MMVSRSISLFVILVALSCTIGCISHYSPDDSVLQRIQLPEARRIQLKSYGDAFPRWCDASVNWIPNCDKVHEVKVINGNIVIVAQGGKKISFSLKNIKVEVTIMPGGMKRKEASVKINDRGDLWCLTEDSAKQFADAVFVLKKDAGAEEQKEADFETVAQAYRSAATPPRISEEVRRYKVQAEGAVRDRSFDDAADLYGKALDIAPWWPQGHFNRALVLSEVGEFETAIIEMKRYLRLVPDAPDARAAQDKVYEWERKAH